MAVLTITYNLSSSKNSKMSTFFFIWNFAFLQPKKVLLLNGRVFVMNGVFLFFFFFNFIYSSSYFCHAFVQTSCYHVNKIRFVLELGSYPLSQTPPQDTKVFRDLRDLCSVMCSLFPKPSMFLQTSGVFEELKITWGRMSNEYKMKRKTNVPICVGRNSESFATVEDGDA